MHAQLVFSIQLYRWRSLCFHSWFRCQKHSRQWICPYLQTCYKTFDLINFTAVQNISAVHYQLHRHAVLFKIENRVSDYNKLSERKKSRYLNNIDSQVTNMLINVEKKCRKLRTGNISFSPHLSKLGLTWKFWRKALHCD